MFNMLLVFYISVEVVSSRLKWILSLFLVSSRLSYRTESDFLHFHFMFRLLHHALTVQGCCSYKFMRRHWHVHQLAGLYLLISDGRGNYIMQSFVPRVVSPLPLQLSAVQRHSHFLIIVCRETASLQTHWIKLRLNYFIKNNVGNNKGKNNKNRVGPIYVNLIDCGISLTNTTNA